MGTSTLNWNSTIQFYVIFESIRENHRDLQCRYLDSEMRMSVIKSYVVPISSNAFQKFLQMGTSTFDWDLTIQFDVIFESVGENKHDLQCCLLDSEMRMSFIKSYVVPIFSNVFQKFLQMGTSTLDWNLAIQFDVIFESVRKNQRELQCRYLDSETRMSVTNSYVVPISSNAFQKFL